MQILNLITEGSIQFSGDIFGIDKNVFFLAFLSSFFATAIGKKRSVYGAVCQICFITIVTAASTPVVKGILVLYINKNFNGKTEELIELTDGFNIMIPVIIAGFFEYMPRVFKFALEFYTTNLGNKKIK